VNILPGNPSGHEAMGFFRDPPKPAPESGGPVTEPLSGSVPFRQSGPVTGTGHSQSRRLVPAFSIAGASPLMLIAAGAVLALAFVGLVLLLKGGNATPQRNAATTPTTATAGASSSVSLNQRQQGYDAQVKSDLRDVATAEEFYLTDNQSGYTNVLADLNSATGPGALKLSANDSVNVYVDGAVGFCLTGNNSASSDFFLYDSQNGGLSSTPFTSEAIAEAGCSDASAA
jgi:hypothetical protein